jgi:hypothetical protein
VWLGAPLEQSLKYVMAFTFNPECLPTYIASRSQLAIFSKTSSLLCALSLPLSCALVLKGKRKGKKFVSLSLCSESELRGPEQLFSELLSVIQEGGTMKWV